MKVWIEPSYREPHSADGRSYIDKRVSREWRVVFEGVLRATLPTRKLAREHIRALKAGQPV